MLSVVIITKNEEANLARCLESVQWADEIIVLDAGSQDATCDIAKRYTSHVYVNTDWQGYGVQKQRALAFATKPWILNLDADESVTETLKAAIEHAMRQQSADAYRIPIRMFFYGKMLQYSASPSRHIRLFKREGAQFSDDKIHEKIILPPGARIERLSPCIHHHSFQDVHHALDKMNRYSSCSADIKREAQNPVSFSRALLNASWMFLRCFFIQRGFLDGRAGFLMAFLSAEGAFYRGIKQVYPDISRG